MISVSWLIIGILAAVVVIALDPKKGGLLGALLVGIVGATLGGFTAGLMGGVAKDFGFTTIALVIVFSVSLLFISRTLKRV